MRIKGLCTEREMRISQLAYVAGMPPSTLKNIMKGNSKNTGIVTIKMICDGLNISLDEFSTAGYFRILSRRLTEKPVHKAGAVY